MFVHERRIIGDIVMNGEELTTGIKERLGQLIENVDSVLISKQNQHVLATHSAVLNEIMECVKSIHADLKEHGEIKYAGCYKCKCTGKLNSGLFTITCDACYGSGKI